MESIQVAARMCLFASLWCATTVATAQPKYAMHFLAPLSIDDAYIPHASRISEDGTIAGSFRRSESGNVYYQGVIWGDDVMAVPKLDKTLPGGGVTGINSHGMAVGSDSGANYWTGRGWSYQNGVLSPLIGGISQSVWDLSEYDVACGFLVDESRTLHAATWTNGAVHQLGDFGGESQAHGVGDTGVVGGAIKLPGASKYRAAFWQPGSVDPQFMYQVGEDSSIDAVSSNGLMAGTASWSEILTKPFFVRDGQTTFLDPLDGEGIYLRGVNASGMVVGFGTHGLDPARGMLWEDGSAYDFNDLVAGLDRDRYLVEQLTGVNDAGTIIGQVYDWQTGHSMPASFVAVPEPSALFIVAAGLGALARRRRRR